MPTTPHIAHQPTHARRYTTVLLVVAGVCLALIMLWLGYSWQVVAAVLAVFVLAAALGVWLPRRIRARRPRSIT